MRDRGRAGTVAFREVLEDRPPDYVPPDSNLEGRVNMLLERDGQAPMRRQVDLGDEVWTGRVDLVDPDRPVVVEVLSLRYHAALCDRRADAERFARLRAGGWVVVGLWDHQVWARGREVCTVIRRIRTLLDAGVAPGSTLLAFTLDLHERSMGGPLLPLLSPNMT